MASLKAALERGRKKKGAAEADEAAAATQAPAAPAQKPARAKKSKVNAGLLQP